jgi:hypothetical protein
MGAEENTAHGRPREDDEADAEIPVHPFADRFPMIDDEALDELALSIAENGLRHPILLSRDGQLIDGRNRLEACRRAGVKPRFETVDSDPVPLILDENVRRRHMSKSQQAVATAMAYPEPTKSKRHSSLGEELEGVSVTMLHKARLVLHYTEPAADLVLAGRRSLNDAYADAKQIRDREASVEGRLHRLTLTNGDLGAQVVDGTLTLGEAEAAANARLQAELEAAAERKRVAGVASGHLSTVLTLAGVERLADPAERARHWLEQVRIGPYIGPELTPEICGNMVRLFSEMAEALREKAR